MAIYSPKRKTSSGTEEVQLPISSINGLQAKLDTFVTADKIPTVNNGTLTITLNGTSKGTFTANQSGNSTIALTDTGATSVTVSGSGNAVTSASYNSSTRQVTLTKGTTFVSNVTAKAGANINSVGTPSVTVTTSNGVTTLTFNYLKGATGATGATGSQGVGISSITITEV